MKIKKWLQKSPALVIPEHNGRFCLYSDRSKFSTGSALNQIQNEQLGLIAHVSKRLSAAAQKYFITELKLSGLAINIASFSHLLKRVDFDVLVDHLALIHIMKSKSELATTRI